MKMAKVYLSLDKKWFDKNYPKFTAAFDAAEDEGEYKGTGLLIDMTVSPDEYQIDDGGIIKCAGGNPDDDTLNYVRIEFKPDIEELINLSGLVVKYYNKMKSAMESIKSI